ncbi:caspase family protein [Shimia sp. Alg240-R146]|uniref:caspase family protein n=1 Tax=Shimia sp. Alg240-R146 TaxID=2993449 RepID=UPI0022DFD76E|nr:caspase family protein [Shimia sp. Alg240-R146]
MWLSFVNVAAAQNSHVALVIGNGHYRDLPNLPNATRDARLIAHMLKRLGYKTVLVTDTTREQMLGAVEQVRVFAKNASQVVIYYSGHGVEINGASLILMQDAPKKGLHQLRHAVSVSELISVFADQPRQKIVLLDACRDNPLLIGANLSGQTDQHIMAGTFLGFAAQPGGSAFDGKARIGPFARAVVTELAQPVQPIEDLMRNVRLRVVTETGGQQVPWSMNSLMRPAYLSSRPGL